jgi:P-type E1-E2 ATPase
VSIVVPLPDADLELTRLILDINGTLAIDGDLVPGVEERVRALTTRIDVVMVSGDTFGSARRIADRLGVGLHVLDPVDQGMQKLRIARRLGPAATAMIGNGRNDANALAEPALGICVVGPEGASRHAAEASDLVIATPELALDLLLHPRRLVSTLRR